MVGTDEKGGDQEYPDELIGIGEPGVPTDSESGELPEELQGLVPENLELVLHGMIAERRDDIERLRALGPEDTGMYRVVRPVDVSTLDRAALESIARNNYMVRRILEVIYEYTANTVNSLIAPLRGGRHPYSEMPGLKQLKEMMRGLSKVDTKKRVDMLRAFNNKISDVLTPLAGSLVILSGRVQHLRAKDNVYSEAVNIIEGIKETMIKYPGLINEKVREKLKEQGYFEKPLDKQNIEEVTGLVAAVIRASPAIYADYETECLTLRPLKAEIVKRLERFSAYEEIKVFDESGELNIRSTLDNLLQYQKDHAERLEGLSTRVGLVNRAADRITQLLELCYKAGIKYPEATYLVDGKTISEEEFFKLGVKQREEKKYDEAFETFSQIVTFNPKNVDAYSNLGMICRNRGQKEQALRYFNRALEIDPTHKFSRKNIEKLLQSK